MRILGSIVQVPTRPMPNIGHDRSLSDAIATQTVCDEASCSATRIASSKNAPERVEHCLTQNAPGATSACQSDYAGSGAFSA